MNSGNQRSISLTNGTLSPDLRVNYEYGLILGVNEFRQEQEYFLEKDFQSNQGLFGYGTISGLAVTADSLPGKEVHVTVQPGLAIDQLGRPVAVRIEQCANLGAWLSKQSAADLKQHIDSSGKASVAIVISYSEETEQPVPVVGSPSNGSVSSVPSRIRDTFNLDFCWDTPKMPAWDVVRCFAKLMARVRIKSDDTPNDEQAIIDQVRKLAQPNSIDHSGSSDNNVEVEETPWHLPADIAREALDRIFTIWVTEVRPKLLPNALNPVVDNASDTSILLARLNFTIDTTSRASVPPILSFDQPDSNGRPYLLQTQAIQELLLLGRRDSIMSSDDGKVRARREFATLQVRNQQTLYAWVHHPAALLLSANDGNWSNMLEITSNGQPLSIVNVTPIEDAKSKNVFEITVGANTPPNTNGPSSTNASQPAPLMVPGARIELTFKINNISAEDDDDDGEQTERPVRKVIEEIGQGIKAAEEVAEKDAKAVEHEAEKVVGLGVKAVGEGVKLVGDGIEIVGKAVEKELKTVGSDIEKAGQGVEKTGENIEAAGQKITDAAKPASVKPNDSHSISLRRQISSFGIDYVGYDHKSNTITVYTIANHTPVRELVTFFTYDQQADNSSAPNQALNSAVEEERFLALWFHTNEPVKLPNTIQVQRVFINQPNQIMQFKATPAPGNTFSSFWALTPQEKEATLMPGELTTVTFDTDAILVGSEKSSKRLTDVMKEQRFTCVGYDGNHTIESHHQISFPRSIPQMPSLPFVTITHIANQIPRGSKTIDASFELWFHPAPDLDDGSVTLGEKISFEIQLEPSNQRTHSKIHVASTTAIQPNVFTTSIALPLTEANKTGLYLRFIFPLDHNPVSIRGGRSFQNLREYMQNTGRRFTGYNGNNAIIAQVRIPTSNTPKE